MALRLPSRIDHVRAHGGDLVWCTRTRAARFYVAQGFETHGDELELPGIGPHYVMMKRIE